MFVKIPLKIHYPLTEIGDVGMKKSVDAFLDLLIASDKYSCIADSDFGFALEDFRYESFSVDKAKFMESLKSSSLSNEIDLLSSIRNPLYFKKIIGNSKNEDTFSRELKRTIERYERRLKDVNVMMDFQDRCSKVRITVTGRLADGNHTFYSYEFKTNVW
ncbi:MAG: hypothetical protein ACTTKO_08430 [Candidatus Limimorpha sp.]